MIIYTMSRLSDSILYDVSIYKTGVYTPDQSCCTKVFGPTSVRTHPERFSDSCAPFSLASYLLSSHESETDRKGVRCDQVSGSPWYK